MEDWSDSDVTELSCSSILDAAREGHVDCIEELIGRRLRSRTSEILEAVNVHSVPDRKSPLQLSARGGHVECVDLLIDAGADINWQDLTGRTALHHAALCGEAEDERAASCVRSLIAAGANVSVKTEWGQTALHLAASRESVQVMKVLLSTECDVDEKDFEGRTALHDAVHGCRLRTKKKQECIQLLLAHGASVNARDDRLWTPHDIACCNAREYFVSDLGSEDAIVPVQILLEAGADVDKLTLFMILCKSMCKVCRELDSNSDDYDRGVKTHMGVLELLIEHGVDFLEGIKDEEFQEPLIATLCNTVKFATSEFLRCLLKLRGLKLWTMRVSTLLVGAVESFLDGPEKLRILLDAGTPANAGIDGRLALLSCAESLPSTPQFHNSVNMFNTLVSNGANPCIAPEECVIDHHYAGRVCLCGQYLLHTAIENGNVAVVEAILKTGVDACVPCHGDHLREVPSHYPLITALNVSQAHGPSLVQLLLSDGADPTTVLQPAIDSSTPSFVNNLCPRSIDIRAITSVLALLPIIPSRCQEHQSVECCETLLTHISSPPSLQECCRAIICSSFRVNRIRRQGLWEAVRSLPIPNIMKDFLLAPLGLRVNSPVGDKMA